MTVFLRPTAPVLRRHLFPDRSRATGMPASRSVLEAVDDAWATRRDDVAEQAEQLTQRSARRASGRGRRPAGAGILDGAVAPAARALRRASGAASAGAPKFPQACPSVSAARLTPAPATRPLAMPRRRSTRMAAGRHARSARRRLPPLRASTALARAALREDALRQRAARPAYLEAWAVDRRAALPRRRRGDARLPAARDAPPTAGSSRPQDADTDGVEGSTYVWTPAELERVLGAEDARGPRPHYGVTAAGNFEGATVFALRASLRRTSTDIRARMLAARDARPQPARDDKAIAAWNGLALAALAQGAWRLGRDDLLDAARACAAFLDRAHDAPRRPPPAVVPRRRRAHPGVPRRLRGGRARNLELATATGDARYLARAEQLARAAVELFSDAANGGFLYSASDAEQLVAQHKEFDDNPTPSGNSLLAHVLIRLGRIHGDRELERLAAGALRIPLDMVRRAPHAFGQLLSAVDLYLSAPREVAVIGPRDDMATAALRDAARSGFHPTAVYAFGDGTSAAGVPLLEGKGLVDGRPAVYICERFACRAPLTDADAVANAMAA